MSERKIEIKPGKRIRLWGGWYQHDKVVVDGAELEGCVQTRRRNKRTDVITGFRDSCVLGYNIEWLIRMNKERQSVTTP